MRLIRCFTIEAGIDKDGRAVVRLTLDDRTTYMEPESATELALRLNEAVASFGAVMKGAIQ
jgi:hypothetical protein